MKVLLLELNEFNEALLREAGETLRLKNIQRLFTFHRSETETEDTYESDALEPWVQWTSVHTGVPYAKHGVKHLGDIPQGSFPQLWEKLSAKGISSGIWGAMNARRNEARHCLFFLPDLWTDSEMGFPEELNALLMPLKYTSKNYTNPSKLALIRPMFRLFHLFHANHLKGCLTKELLSLLKNGLLYKGKPFVFVSSLDSLSTRLFLQYRARFQPDFSLLFLNTIAHLQHHQWQQRNLLPSDPLAFGFRRIDQILKHIFDQMNSEDVLIAANALSQKNTADEPPWILYRPIDPKKFLQAIGIQDVIVESHMTHDAHLFFPSAASAQRAKSILESAAVQGRPLFYTETYPKQPHKLFYRIQFTEGLPKEASFGISDQTFRFFDFFTAIVKRTGKHIQKGTLFCNAPYFPPKLANHTIGEIVCHIFQNCQRKEPLTPQSR